MTNAQTYDDKALRSYFRLLKQILAQVLKTEAGPNISGMVEQLQRQFAALQRDNTPSRRRQLSDTLNKLPPEAQTEVIRAFSMFFSLLNIAEESANLHQRRRSAENDKHFGRAHSTIRCLTYAKPASMRSSCSVCSTI